jgi:hypothetical protein
MNSSNPTPFLRLVANDLLKQFGTNLAELTVVFPSRRARLFFNQHLYEEVNHPLWSPQYVSIEELFESISPYSKADPIQLTGELFRSYTSVKNASSTSPSPKGKEEAETLDEFFFFGEILLHDFDNIDKNLVDPKALFSNLHDLDRLKDDFSHLSENQREALSRFRNIFMGESDLKTAFASIWNLLGDVYATLKENLRLQGLAYPGMLMREIIENESIEFSGKQYAFVGFNVLNKCEESLFRRLKYKSLYYWDYDAYYLYTEAGRFIRKNIITFGSALDDSGFDVFLNQRKEITFLAASSESGQTGVIPSWIDSLRPSTDFNDPDSAIVLCNESILPVVIHAIPPTGVENVNITMGFPITQTPVAGFLQALSDLQTKGSSSSGVFHYKYVLPVLRHPYTRIIFPEAPEIERIITEGNIFFPDIKILRNELIFSSTTDATGISNYLLNLVESLGKSYTDTNCHGGLDPSSSEKSKDVYDDLYQESIFRAYQVVNRLYGLLQSGQWTLEKPTFLRLLRKLLSVTHVPFHGEPVKGLQIIGVLETRTLDFKHLLLLSVNEGLMPGTNNDNTFIPEFLRKHFELSTIDHHDSIYAYYFYRLIQRAEKITFVYNTDKTLTGKAEMSRFLLQLLIDPRLKIQRRTLQSSIKPWQAQPVVISKTDEIIQKIKELYDFNTNPEARPLTPSHLNTFIDCSLRFYFQKIKGYETPDEISDELDSSVFGTIFHQAAESLYRALCHPALDAGSPDKLEIAGLRYATPAMTNLLRRSVFTVEKSHLDTYLQPDSDYRIRKFVSRAFQKVYFKGRAVDESQYNGEQLINFNVICKMLKRLIEFDSQRTPFTVIGLEWKDYDFFELEDYPVKLKIGGVIDRIEEKDGKRWILDYKTGGSAKTFKTLEDLVSEKDKRASHIFQIFVYASVFLRLDGSALPVVPALFYMQDMGKENYSPVILYEKEPITDFRDINSSFEKLYLQKVSSLFNPDVPFQQTAFDSNCSYCEFRELCNR